MTLWPSRALTGLMFGFLLTAAGEGLEPSLRAAAPALPFLPEVGFGYNRDLANQHA
jgi:hypothetical protein